MLLNITTQEWVFLITALVAFLGPGIAIVALFSSNQCRPIYSLFVACCVSTSLLSVLLVWLRVLNLSLSASIIWLICVLGWLTAIVVIVLRKLKRIPGDNNLLSFDKTDFIILVSIGLYLGVQLWVRGNQVAGSGSDSFHHTLIASMIFENGVLPSGYQPYAPIITFKYHFGYHVFIAALGWLSNWPIRLLVLTSGPLLVVFLALSIGFLIRSFSANRLWELVAINLLLFITILPAALLNWGRYPQLFGYSIMLALFALVYSWITTGLKLRATPFIALLAAGLFFTHYRVTIMAAIGLPLLVLLMMAFGQLKLSKKLILDLMIPIALCATLTAPWLWNLIRPNSQGIEVAKILSTDLSNIPPNLSFYSINRLGAPVLEYFTNLPLLILTGIGILIACYKKEILAIWQAVWWLCMLVIVNLNVNGSFDPVTIYMTVLIPVVIIVGWMLGTMTTMLIRVNSNRTLQYTLASIFIIICIVGSVKGASFLQSSIEPYVFPCDLEASDWIQQHTPPNATFMVNTFAFPFNPNFIIGFDGGYWLPVLAKRSTVVPPMPYGIERFESAKMLKALVRLHHFEGHLNSPEAAEALTRANASYVYIGGRGGMISPDELIESPNFDLLFENNSCYVYKITNIGGGDN